MREAWAERVLARVMNWTAEDVARERSELQVLATFKYDEYQQFSPGMRFIESLALWLHQFQSGEERNTAYHLLRTKLVFISAAEMHHLVISAFPDVIRPFLIDKVASTLNIPPWRVAHLLSCTEFKVLLRQSLFLGLSDGAHIDAFRRANPHLSNEQVWTTYELSADKQENLRDELSSDLARLLKRDSTPEDALFRVVFLLDDFSGSGVSYFRQETANEKELYKGKIAKIFQRIQNDDLKTLVASEDVHIVIMLYAATEGALSYLQNAIDQWSTESGATFSYTLLPVQKLSCDLAVSVEQGLELDILLKRYFDDSIINESWRKGRYNNPHLGFDECALPLILSHNTPNNTLPLFWFEETRNVRGVFPRVSRH